MRIKSYIFKIIEAFFKFAVELMHHLGELSAVHSKAVALRFNKKSKAKFNLNSVLWTSYHS